MELLSASPLNAWTIEGTPLPFQCYRGSLTVTADLVDSAYHARSRLAVALCHAPMTCYGISWWSRHKDLGLEFKYTAAVHLALTARMHLDHGALYAETLDDYYHHTGEHYDKPSDSNINSVGWPWRKEKGCPWPHHLATARWWRDRAAADGLLLSVLPPPAPEAMFADNNYGD
ncbi:hypothetical protein BC828DRAFT_409637 [Blastocladiella britannica]|nr:hypothetical protein BC828DRAFT_409637 [Blastocladiella britannica]